jgi:two-component system CheB/CheR fusion protein
MPDDAPVLPAKPRQAPGDASRLREVLDGMGEGFVLLDADFRVVLANPRAAAIDGRPAAALLGGGFWDLWPEAMGTPLEAALRRCMADAEPFRLDHRHAGRHRDVWLDVRGWPSGGGAALLYADVTEARRAAQGREAAAERDRRQLAELEALYRNGPIGFALLDPGLRYLRCNEALAEINGVPAADHLGRTVREVVPGVAGAVEGVFRSVFETGRPVTGLEIEGETPREPGRRRAWMENVAPLAGPDGRVWAALVTVQEVTERREAEAARALMAREADHRAKNLLAVAEALVAMTGSDSVEGFREALLGRLRALRRAQPPTGAGTGGTVELAGLVADELAPYEGRHAAAGPPVRLAEDAALPVALSLHELATNAAKHGALSVPGGQVLVSWDAGGGGLALRWREEGGPAVAGPPARGGFGSRLLAQAVSHQAGGTLALDWHPAGLRCTITLPASALAGDGAPHGPGPHAGRG